MPRGLDLDAAILCGGLGTRLAPALPGVPKVLAPIGGKPFLDRLLVALTGAGCGRIVLCTGVGAEGVETYAAEHPRGAEISYSREAAPLGTGGALGRARPQLHSDPVLVLNGDSIVPGLDFADFLRAYRRSQAAGALVVVPADQRTDTGVIALDGGGRIASFTEKAGVGGGFHNAGIYLFSQALLASIPGDAVSSLERDWLPGWLAAGLFGYVHAGALLDIGTPERWADAQTRLA